MGEGLFFAPLPLAGEGGQPKRWTGEGCVKICVYGAGAIGGYVAVQLARSGVETSVVARGPHLAAIQQNGLTLKIAGETHTVKLAASHDPATLGQQDYVIVTLKAHQIAGGRGADQDAVRAGDGDPLRRQRRALVVFL